MQDVSLPQKETQSWANANPRHSCVAAKQLPLGTDVEIECIAVMP